MNMIKLIINLNTYYYLLLYNEKNHTNKIHKLTCVCVSESAYVNRKYEN